MTLAIEDIVAYASLNHPLDDSSTSGGGIDLNMRVQFVDLLAPTAVFVSSSDPTDAATVTLLGRTTTGEYESHSIDMLGTSVIVFDTVVYTHILRVQMDADAIGTVSVYDEEGTILGIIPPTERGFTSLFIKAFGDPLSDTVRYEKFFWRNNGSDALHGVTLYESGDDYNAMAHGLASSLGDSGSTADRLTPPGSITFTQAPRNIPSGYFSAGDTIGVWLEQTIPAGIDGYHGTYVGGFAGHTD